MIVKFNDLIMDKFTIIYLNIRSGNFRLSIRNKYNYDGMVILQGCTESINSISTFFSNCVEAITCTINNSPLMLAGCKIHSIFQGISDKDVKYIEGESRIVIIGEPIIDESKIAEYYERTPVFKSKKTKESITGQFHSWKKASLEEEGKSCEKSNCYAKYILDTSGSISVVSNGLTLQDKPLSEKQLIFNHYWCDASKSVEERLKEIENDINII